MSAVLERTAEKVRAADRRAALVAATIVNSNPFRRKGAPPARIEDFIKDPDQYMTPKQARAALTAWAAGVNRNLAVTAKKRRGKVADGDDA